MKKLFVSLAIMMMLFTSVPKSEALIISGPVLGFTAVKTAPVWGPYIITGVVTTFAAVSKKVVPYVAPYVIPYIVSGKKVVKRFIPYGKSTKSGGHDHRYNKGPDRTPAQKRGDLARRK